MLKLYPVIFAALLLPIISSCTTANKANEDALVIIDNTRIEKKADTCDALPTSTLGDLIYSPLLYLSYEGDQVRVHKVLAVDVKVQPGNRSIEIALRDGIMSHDGKEFTSHDMVAAVEYLKKQAGLFGDRYKELRVEVIDRRRFRLTNDTPLFDIEHFLNNIYAYYPFCSEKPVGTGPFRFSRWLDDGVELAANETYFEGRPRIKKVRYIYEEVERKRLARLLSGEADLMVMVSPEIARFIEKDVRFRVNHSPGRKYTAIFLNNRSPLFRDRTVRRAVSLAIDRDTLIEKGLKGAAVKALGLIHFENTAASSPFDYRPKEAVKLLNEAGWRSMGPVLEKNGRRLRLRLYYDRDLEENKIVIDMLSQSLFEVGIEMEGVPIDTDEFRRTHLKEGDYDAFLTSSSSSDYDNYMRWHSSSSGNNFASYNNQEVDRLLEEIRDSGYIEEKKKVFGRIQEIFNEEVPAAFLYNNLVYTAVSKRFKGADDFLGNVYSVYKIKDWSVNEDTR